MVNDYIDLSSSKEASIYIHIPFCKKKCAYCHFYVVPDCPDKQESLFQGILQEWSLRKTLFQDKQLVSIYLGGGTPILLDPYKCQFLLNQILQDTNPSSDIEITLEANPEEVNFPKMRFFSEIGINRVSLGVQTHHNGLLQLLGRQHSGYKAFEAVKTTAEAGILNISIDLMYELPDQNFSLWKETLEQTIELPITHLSLYNLTIEPQTLFHKKRKELESRLPSSEISSLMFRHARQFLPSHGLVPYEISAFAKPGYPSRHNSGYWTGRPFIGLGPSAFSYWEGKRFRNIPHLNKYCESLSKQVFPIDFEEKLETEAHLREWIAVRLRLFEPFSIPKTAPRSLQEDIQTLIQKKFLIEEQDKIRLSEQGIMFYDTVASEII